MTQARSEVPQDNYSITPILKLCDRGLDSRSDRAIGHGINDLLTFPPCDRSQTVPGTFRLP
ncbi:MAG: hypothetical protein F6K41_12260 [Symploca sp. SIO3E6]|nr:hypothetical protein [Caldora sp. SIO3E6]